MLKIKYVYQTIVYVAKNSSAFLGTLSKAVKFEKVNFSD